MVCCHPSTRQGPVALPIQRIGVCKDWKAWYGYYRCSLVQLWVLGVHHAATVLVTHRVAQEEALLDDIIDRLLEVRKKKPGKQVQLSENEIRMLCITAKEIFLSQPNLLELEAPIKICGMCAGWVGGGTAFVGGTRTPYTVYASTQVTSTGNTQTCCGCLSMVVSLPRQTTCFLVIM